MWLGRCWEKCVTSTHLNRCVDFILSRTWHVILYLPKAPPPVLTCFSLPSPDSEKRTPLHVAALLGDAEIIELLILSGKYHLYLKVNGMWKLNNQFTRLTATKNPKKVSLLCLWTCIWSLILSVDKGQYKTFFLLKRLPVKLFYVALKVWFLTILT